MAVTEADELARAAKLAQERAKKKKSSQEKKGSLVNSKNLVKSPLSRAKNFGNFIEEIRPGQDLIYFIIIIFSMIADVFTLFPIIGNFLALFWMVLIWILYVLAGDFFKGKTIGLRLASNFGAGFFEVFVPGLNILPVFTGVAILNYTLVLKDRKEQNTKHKETEEK